ncbi:MAG: TolC family protein [Oxalobacteraceae bacterium]|nr:TolC family protein [Oxalobacteraceae bacterium]
MSARLNPFALQWIFAIGLVFLVMTTAVATDNEALPADEIRLLRSLQNLGSDESTRRAELQLRQLVKRALEFSPAMREARYTTDAARQDINAAKGARSPQVNLTSGATTYTGEIPNTSRPDRPYFGVNATVPVYDFGRIAASIKGREAAYDASNARYALQANQVAVDVVTTCLDYTKQRALVFAADDYLEAVQKLADMLTKVTDADPGRRGELVQARSRLLQATQARENARSLAREFRIRLDRLLGADQSALCDGIGAIFLQKPDLESVRAKLVTNPQVMAFQFDYETALRQLDQINASRKPQVQASAVHAPVANGLSNNYYQSFTISMSVPLYDGKILESGERAALERARAAAERIDTTIQQLDTEYRARYELATAALRRTNEYVSLLEINDRVRKDFFVQWYALGRRSLYELLAVELEQYTLQQGYFSSLFDAMSGVGRILGTSGQLVIAE